MKRVAAFLTLLLFACLVPAAAQTPAPLRTLTVDDLFQIREVDDPQASPEGKWVAYTVTTIDLKRDKDETRVWMIPAAGGEALPMSATGSSASRPRWSPDGKYLTFLAAREECKTQVWLLNRGGGEAQQLTTVVQGVRSYEWSPDSRRLVLVIKDPTPEEKAKAEKGDSECGKKDDKTPPPWVIDRLQFKEDGVGYFDHRRNHLFVFDLASKQLTQLTSGDFDDGEPAWSPDGRFLAFVSQRAEDADRTYNSEIWLVAADTPARGATLLRVTTAPGRHNRPAWSPDGQWITYTGATDGGGIFYATEHLAVVSAKGGPAQLLTEKLDRFVGRDGLPSRRFSSDGQSIYFILEGAGQQHLAQIPAKGGEVRRILSGARRVDSYSVGGDGTLAALVSEPHLPGEVFVLQGGSWRQLTTTNDALMGQLRLADVEKIHFASKDGTPLEGFLYKPPGFRAEMRYPTILWIHGGPVRQFDFGFDFRAQLFAAHGYLVVQVNPRGSSGYGQPFAQAIFADWGNKDTEDVLAGVDYAISQGIADPNRLGVGGYSYGGVLTNYVITKSDRFKGAISGAGMFLFVANYGHDHMQRDWELELGLPWQNRALWEKLSPFNAVEKIVTPTLVTCGEKDWNVPVINCEQLYQSLKRLGRETQLVVYPGESHGIKRPSYRKDLYQRRVAWFDKYVKGTGSSPPESTGILFDSDRSGSNEIFLMESDGSNVRQTTNVGKRGVASRVPDWSPDGKQIVFQSNRDGNAELYVMDADGRNVRRLTSTPEEEGAPAWSPDGKRIAYGLAIQEASGKHISSHIWIMNADGSGARPLTTGAGRNWFPAWFPDGSSLAFASNRGAELFDIWVMDADGSNPRRLTQSAGTNGGPAWSPDGTEIALDSTRDGNWELYLMNADGSNVRRLTHTPDRSEARPAWSPDGTRIAFNAGKEGARATYEICVVNADGSNQQCLTNNDSVDAHPDWR